MGPLDIFKMVEFETKKKQFVDDSLPEEENLVKIQRKKVVQTKESKEAIKKKE